MTPFGFIPVIEATALAACPVASSKKTTKKTR
jgi:hypothetical protein